MVQQQHPTTSDAGKVVTAGDVANAINNIVSNVQELEVQETGTYIRTVSNELIKAGDTVTLQVGNNLNVNQANGIFTYSLLDDIKLNRQKQEKIQLEKNKGKKCG